MAKRILLIGNVVDPQGNLGYHRNQSLVGALLANHYEIAIVTPRYYYARAASKGFAGRVWRRLRYYFAQAVYYLEVLFKAPFCDALYLLPLASKELPIAYLAKTLSRKPLISELLLSLYDQGRDRQRYKDKSSFAARYAQFLDRTLIERSDVVIHTARMELDYIAGLVGAEVQAERVVILPIATEPGAVADPSPSSVFRICWWGKFIPLHGLDRILRAFKLVREAREDVRLDLFGIPGPAGDPYRKLIDDLGLSQSVTLHTDKSFSNGKLEQHLQHHCDLALGVFGDSDRARYTVTNKVTEGLSMRLPVLTMNSPALAEFIDTDSEIFVCDNQPEAIAKAFMEIIGDDEERLKRAQAGYRRFLETFSMEQFTDGVIELLSTIGSAPRPKRIAAPHPKEA